MSSAETPQMDVTEREAGGGWQATLGEHALAGLALAAIGLAFFAASRVGNNLGIDDWIHFYYVFYLRSLHFADRPLSLILLGALQPLAGTDYLIYHAAMLAVRIAGAWFIYLSVRHLAPDDPLFAFACGALFLTFFVHDFFLLLTPIYIADSVASLFFTLAALAAYFVTMQRRKLPLAVWLPLLALTVTLAYVSPQVREASIPLLVGAPVLAFLAQRQFDRRRIIGLAAWLAAVLLSGRTIILSVLGLGGQTYASGLFEGFNLSGLLVASHKQFHFAFYDLILPTWEWYPRQLFALATAALVLASLFGLARRSRWGEAGGGGWRTSGRYAAFAAGGLAATWLGFATYLPTMFALSTIRTHVLAMAGEAVLLASLIWLAGSLVREGAGRRTVWVLGVAYVVFCGTASIGRTQDQITNQLAGTRENTAYFMRSLAHLAPDVTEPTLFVYVETPGLPEAPFTSGFSFQYAVRYFYDNRATGMIPTDTILGEWSMSDDGITMAEAWVPERPQFFPWEHVIFLQREPSGRLFILEEPPADFAPEAARARYDPQRLIARAYIPERVQETFPILVDMPGWKAALEQHSRQ